MVSYAPLWKTMEEKHISTYALINKHGFSARTINNLKHNRSITMYTLEKLCAVLGCQASDVVTFVPDENEKV